jgi:FkbH-like protein
MDTKHTMTQSHPGNPEFGVRGDDAQWLPGSGHAGDRRVPVTDLLLVADSSVDPIIRFLADPTCPPAIKATVAPYNQVQQVLADIACRDRSDNIETVMVWTRPEGAIPTFSKILQFEPPALDDLLAEVDQFAGLICEAARRVGTVFVLSWALPPYRRWIQAITLRHESGLGNILMRMNLRLAERFCESNNIILLDCQQWYASLQKPAYDAKLHALAKVDYSRDFFVKAASEIKAVLQGLRGQARKLVICDLDNTLWGGVIGDDGMENVKLGGHDGMGESFVAFQQELLALRKRGILLGICSKNDPELAWKMIDEHSEMALRRADFASAKINWSDKAENISQMLRELNLLPESAVFLDDHPAERERVRQAFPGMLVPDLPADVAGYAAFLAGLDCFETGSITAEDRARTGFYRKEAEGRAVIACGGSIQAWLESLQIVLKVEKLDRGNLVRAAQLLNKTNQFNMATRRMDQEDFWRWCISPGHQAWIFSVMDRLGDSGITGLITVDLTNAQQARLVDFVMSCRVMGKQIEEAMLNVVKGALEVRGARELSTSYHRTDRNQPFLDFIKNKWMHGAGDVLEMSKIAPPPHIRIEQETPPG